MKKLVLSFIALAIIVLTLSSCAKSTITIIFDSQGGTAVQEKTINIGQAVTLPNEPIKEGFIFSGWYTEKDGTGIKINNNSFPTSDMTLYAYWISGDAYNITFDPQNGESSSTYQVSANAYILIPDEPKYESFYFAGWFSEKNGEGEKLTDSTPATKDIVYYAFWSDIPSQTEDQQQIPRQLPVIYLDSCGGLPEYPPYVVTDVTFDFPTPTNNEYLFGGWFTERDGEGTEFTSSTKIENDVRLYAYWIRTSGQQNERSYTLTLYLDGEVYKTYTVSESFTPDLPVPEKAGFEFSGWYTRENGEGRRINSSTLFTSDTSAYAFWETSENSYKVIFHYNDGTDKSDTQYVEEGRAASIPEISRDGYIFKGWLTKDGQEIKNTTPIMADIEAYAQWEKIQSDPEQPDDTEEQPQEPETPDIPDQPQEPDDTEEPVTEE